MRENSEANAYRLSRITAFAMRIPEILSNAFNRAALFLARSSAESDVHIAVCMALSASLSAPSVAICSAIESAAGDTAPVQSFPSCSIRFREKA